MGALIFAATMGCVRFVLVARAFGAAFARACLLHVRAVFYGVHGACGRPHASAPRAARDADNFAPPASHFVRVRAVSLPHCGAQGLGGGDPRRCGERQHRQWLLEYALVCKYVPTETWTAVCRAFGTLPWHATSVQQVLLTPTNDTYAVKSCPCAWLCACVTLAESN